LLLVANGCWLGGRAGLAACPSFGAQGAKTSQRVIQQFQTVDTLFIYYCIGFFIQRCPPAVRELPTYSTYLPVALDRATIEGVRAPRSVHHHSSHDDDEIVVASTEVEHSYYSLGPDEEEAWLGTPNLCSLQTASLLAPRQVKRRLGGCSKL
jgi:hypothetical protein